MDGLNIGCDQTDFDAKRLGGLVNPHVPSPEVYGKLVGSKGKGGCSDLKLTVGSRLMEEATLQAKGLLEEQERRRHVWNIDDRVAQLHGEYLEKGLPLLTRVQPEDIQKLLEFLRGCFKNRDLSKKAHSV
jgi:hypothetical protein